MTTGPEITQNAVNFLKTDAGRAAARELARLPADYLKRLQWAQKHLPADYAAFAVVQQERRERARNKFARAEAMFFTAEGLEQATGDAAALYHMYRFPQDAPVLDACCGIGNDALHLARRGPVLAVDTSREAVLCARANAQISQNGNSHPVHALCADVTALDLSRLVRAGIRAAFFDPSRRAGRANHDRHRVRRGSDYAPPLEWLNTLRQHIPALGVKVSPAIDDETLQAYPDAQIVFVSYKGECKECVLWFGSCVDDWQPPGVLGAVVLHDTYAPTALPFVTNAFPLVREPGAWLIEPDPAVIRAHLIPSLAQILEADLLDPHIAYLTADTFTPCPFAVSYRVLDWLPFHLRDVQKRLERMNRRAAAIKKRGVDIDPAALIKRLPGDKNSDAPAVLVLTRRGEKIIALICEPAQSDAIPPPNPPATACAA